MNMITVLYNMNTNKKVKMDKATIKDLYIGRKYGCQCQRCGKEVHGRNAHMHHKSSRTKKANMANIWGLKGWEKEAKKCTLFCDECHNLYHILYGKVSTIKNTTTFIKQGKIEREDI